MAEIDSGTVVVPGSDCAWEKVAAAAPAATGATAASDLCEAGRDGEYVVVVVPDEAG